MIYPSYKRPIEYINHVPYLIHAVIPVDRVRNAKMIKEWLGVDTAFKFKGTHYWFCEEIKEANWENV